MRILVAEDEPFDLDVCQKTLAIRGHEVVTTTNGENCLEIYYDNLNRMWTRDDNVSPARPFDVVILDFLMPEMNGRQVAKEILSLNPKQKIIFVTAYLVDTLIKTLDELKPFAIKLIQKPFEPNVLIDLAENMQSRILDNAAVSLDCKTGAKDNPSCEANIETLLEKLNRIQRK